MDLKTEKNITEGKAAFEDLHLLADPVLFPLISRAFHHFSEVASSTYQKDLLADLPVLQKFLSENLQGLLDQFFLKRADNLSWSLIKDEKNLEIQHWEKLLTILPDLLQVVGFFKYQESVKFEFNPRGLIIKGKVSTIQNFDDDRVLIYKAFRNLLSKKTLLTFDVLEDSNATELTLFADISDDVSQVRAFEFFPFQDKKQSALIAFSNVLNNYCITLEKFESLGDHLIIEINSSLQVVRHEKIPDDYRSRYTSAEIIYFHFLFRPISLIIGCKGKNFPRHALGGTGRGLYGTSQEVGKTFDLFSLLSM